MTVSTFHCRYCGSTEKHDRRRCRMLAVTKDPEFRARNAEATREKWQDPEFRARHAEAVRDATAPHLVHLTDAERADYDLLKSKGYSVHDALRGIGRGDLIAEAVE